MYVYVCMYIYVFYVYICWSWNSSTLAIWCEELTYIGKDPDDGKDRRQEEKGMTKGKMIGWHYQLNGHEFE